MKTSPTPLGFSRGVRDIRRGAQGARVGSTFRPVGVAWALCGPHNGHLFSKFVTFAFHQVPMWAHAAMPESLNHLCAHIVGSGTV